MHGPEPGRHATAADLADEQEAIFAEINITPLVDVVLVLLIIFMVSSSAMVDAVREGHLEVTLPTAGHAHAPQGEAPALVVGMGEDGRLLVHGAFVDEEELERVLARTYQEAPTTAVIVDADGRLSHKSVVRIIDKVRAAGFPTVGIGAEGG